MASMFTSEWVFVGEGEGAKAPFNSHYPMTSGLQQLLFPFPGSIQGKNSSPLKFTELVTTGDRTGTVDQDKILERSFMGPARPNPELPLLRRQTGEKYVLAAWIHGELKEDKMPMSDKDAADDVAGEPAADQPATDAADEQMDDEDHADDKRAAPASDSSIPNDPVHAGIRAKKDAQKAKDAKDAQDSPPAKDRPINVVLVSDMDCLYSAFFAIRARGEEADDEITWDFDNVTFVLNVLDTLAGDERFIPIRSRRPVHRTLTKVSSANAEAQAKVEDAREKANKEFNDAKREEQKKFDEQIAAIKKRSGGDARQLLTEVAIAQQTGQRRLDTKTEQLKQARDKQIREIERNLAGEIRRTQDAYKMWAVLLPPIPPLIVGLIVFFNRRSKEREGVSKARLR
jgi:ABC-2 type transport system permease protein